MHITRQNLKNSCCHKTHWCKNPKYLHIARRNSKNRKCHKTHWCMNPSTRTLEHKNCYSTYHLLGLKVQIVQQIPNWKLTIWIGFMFSVRLWIWNTRTSNIRPPIQFLGESDSDYWVQTKKICEKKSWTTMASIGNIWCTNVGSIRQAWFWQYGFSIYHWYMKHNKRTEGFDELMTIVSWLDCESWTFVHFF